MLMTTTFLLLLALAVIGRGRLADSRLDAREYPFFQAAALAGLPARHLLFEAAPAHENELRDNVSHTSKPSIRLARPVRA